MPVVKKGGKTIHLPYTNKGMKMAENMKKSVKQPMKKAMNTMKKAMPRGK